MAHPQKAPVPHWRDEDGRFYVEVPHVYAARRATAMFNIRKLLARHEGLSEFTPIEIERVETRSSSTVYREVF